MTVSDFEEKYMHNLNEQQKTAVKSVDGAVLLTAVPGSGKTTVLTLRLGYMIFCRGINPENILTMTYTVSAAREMKERFSSVFGDEYARRIEFRTINGISSKIIDYYSKNYGRGRAFELVENERDISKILIEIYIRINGEYPDDGCVRNIKTAITYNKNMMLSETDRENLDTGIGNFPQIYREYCDELKRRRLMDYDDQMFYALTVLETYPPVLEYFREKYRYICVDEAQDTSKIQHRIINLLAQKYKNIFMVGDEDQSIFGFRAAYPEALLEFSLYYPDSAHLLMETNYRSSEEIVNAAAAFISKNRLHLNKNMNSHRGSNQPIRVVEIPDRMTQFKYLYAEACACGRETAVLYRNNDSMLPLVDMLERDGIRYNCKRFDCSFFSDRLINDIRDIIGFAYNMCDADAFMRIYYKFGIQIRKDIAAHACEKSAMSGKDILCELTDEYDAYDQIRNDIVSLRTSLEELKNDDAVTVISRIKNGMRYKKYADVNRLDTGKFDILGLLCRYENDALGLVRRLDELNEIICNHKNSEDVKFWLSTIHSSKGLEYDRVFILDAIDGILPSKNGDVIRKNDDIQLYEEERRIYYVAMTRAKNELCIFLCGDEISSFNNEVRSTLPRELIDENDIFSFCKKKITGKTYSDVDGKKWRVSVCCGDNFLIECGDEAKIMNIDDMFCRRDRKIKYIEGTADDNNTPEKVKYVKEGDILYHRIFGRGEVESIEGDIIAIRFDKNAECRKFGFAFSIQKGILRFEE